VYGGFDWGCFCCGHVSVGCLAVVLRPSAARARGRIYTYSSSPCSIVLDICVERCSALLRETICRLNGDFSGCMLWLLRSGSCVLWRAVWCGETAAMHAYVCSCTSGRTAAGLILYGLTLNGCLALLRRQRQFTTASCAWQQLGGQSCVGRL
jgi:hypothetical protein